MYYDLVLDFPLRLIIDIILIYHRKQRVLQQKTLQGKVLYFYVFFLTYTKCILYTFFCIFLYFLSLYGSFNL